MRKSCDCFSYISSSEIRNLASVSQQNAEDGLQKQRIELDLAESRAKIASEILEKAQKNQEDAIHIDQALQRKVCQISIVLCHRKMKLKVRRNFV